MATKVKVKPKEECLEIASKIYSGLNLSEEDLLDFLPDHVFNKVYDYYAKDEDYYVIVDEFGTEWGISPEFVEDI